MKIKTKNEIKIMKENGRMLAGILEEVRKRVEPGVTTQQLDEFAESRILKGSAVPAFKGYEGFPATLCTSVNETIVHGAPSDYKLKEGDIISLDIGLKKRGFYADMAITVPVGEISYETRRLVKVTRKSLKLAIKKAQPGNTFGDVGELVQRYATGQGFGVIKRLCGHGIGKVLHDSPLIPNHGERGEGDKIEPGMTFCLEPMLSMGKEEIKKDKDGMGYSPKDNSISAHFEHTIGVTKDGPEILTKFPE